MHGNFGDAAAWGCLQITHQEVGVGGYRDCMVQEEESTLRTTNQVETPVPNSIRELVSWECKEHGVKIIMNVLANPKGKCWALESGFLEA